MTIFRVIAVLWVLTLIVLTYLGGPYAFDWYRRKFRQRRARQTYRVNHPAVRQNDSLIRYPVTAEERMRLTREAAEARNQLRPVSHVKRHEEPRVYDWKVDGT